MNLDAIQSALRDQHLDGWLFYDHHHRDPIAYRILGLDENSFVSRRWFYFIPAQGEPGKLVHRIESLLGSEAFRQYATRGGIVGCERELVLAYLLHAVKVIRPSEGLAPNRELLEALAARWREGFGAPE